MILKERVISDELRILKTLNARLQLSGDPKKYYLKLEKGLQGELMFDRYTEKLTRDTIILNDNHSFCYQTLATLLTSGA